MDKVSEEAVWHCREKQFLSNICRVLQAQNIYWIDLD